MGPVFVQIHVNEKLYLKNPAETELGRKIISQSIVELDKLGFEKFTFKKLAKVIKSTEASVYRYFESKHQLLTYLVSWYWSWLHYRVEFQTNNITDPEQRLKVAIKVITELNIDDPATSDVDEATLHRIVISEASKAYLSHSDDTVSYAAFEGYQQFCEQVAEIIRQVSPKFRYPKALVNTIVGSIHRQIYFSENQPHLTEIVLKNGDSSAIVKYLEQIVFSILR